MRTCICVHTLGRNELLPPLLCSGSLEVYQYPDRASREEVRREGKSYYRASSTVSGNVSNLHAKMSCLIASSQVP